MKTIRVIGIGAGNPEQITVEAIEAMNRTDVFFVMDKGPAKAGLAALRHEMCRRYIRHQRYRVVECAPPERDADPADYHAAVDDVNRAKAALFGSLIERELPDGGAGAFLVWGDPSLYDSTLRILLTLESPGLAVSAIPGISSLQALAARHRTTLNQVGEAFEVTTGRRLAEGFAADRASVAVMLDAHATFRRFEGEEIDIFWGAYVGMPEEILISGKLRDVAGQIERRRAQARAAHGWIMDSYILHRAHPASASHACGDGGGDADGGGGRPGQVLPSEPSRATTPARRR